MSVLLVGQDIVAAAKMTTDIVGRVARPMNLVSDRDVQLSRPTLHSCRYLRVIGIAPCMAAHTTTLVGFRVSLEVVYRQTLQMCCDAILYPILECPILSAGMRHLFSVTSIIDTNSKTLYQMFKLSAWP